MDSNSKIDSDLHKIFASRLQNLDIEFDPSDNVSKLGYLYLNHRKNKIPKTPRSVHLSKQIQERFGQEPQKFQDDLTAFQKLAAAGGDLNPHLSRRVDDPNLNDPLLINWNLRHFHLSQIKDTDGFSKRGGALLFACVAQNDIYLVDFLDHQAFAKKVLIETVNENWPELTQGMKLAGIVGMERQLTDEERKILRRKNGNALVQLGDGTIFAGGLVSTAGTDMLLTMKLDHLRSILRDHFSAIEQEKASVLAQLACQGFSVDDLNLTLVDLKSGVAIVELNTQTALFTFWKDEFD